MPRVRKGAARTQARKRLLKKASGYYGQSSTHKWKAKVAVMWAGVYAYRDRRQRKRDMRGLWITRITAACKMRGTRYSVFMNGLKLAGIGLNRKMLSEVAIHDPKAFDQIVEKALAAAKNAPKVAGGLTFNPNAKSVKPAASPKPAAKPTPAKPAPAPAPVAAVAPVAGMTDDIEDIEGIGPVMAKKLATAGVKTIAGLRQHGRTAAEREKTAEKSGIKPELLHKWTSAADLMRIPGVDGDQAELMEVCGVKNVQTLAKLNGADLAAKMGKSNIDANGKSIAPRVPSASEVSGWITAAKSLPVMVEF